MSSVTLPFSPILPTVTRAVTSSSASVALGTTARTSQTASPTPQGAPTFPGGFSVRVVNDGTVISFIEFGYGSAATAAVASSIPMLPGTAEIFSVGEGCTHISAITASGTATVYATPGQGN
jgi:hypothetical protein